MKFIFLFTAFLFLALSIYGYCLEADSNQFKMSIIALINGAGAISSTNNEAIFTVIGENIVSLEESLSTNTRLLAGQVYLFSLKRLVEKMKVISDLKAKTDIFGGLITEAIWQKDNDPYFYWKVEIEPSDLLTGYSVSLDTSPDLIIDVTANSYFFSENSIISGKHIFYVLPFNSGGLPETDSMLQFEIWVDADMPIIKEINPQAGLVTRDSYIPITCSLFDADSGVDKFNTVLTLNEEGILFEYDSEQQRLKFKPVTALPEGRNTVLLKAYDNVGNFLTKGWDFIVDTQAPAGSILINNGDEVTHSAYVFINIDALDETSGIENIYVSNDSVFDTELSSPYPYSPIISNWLLSSPDVNEKKTVYVKFEDFAGNLSDAYKDEIILELQTPDTHIVSGPSPVTKEKDASFIYESSKAGSRFSYKLDNLDWSSWIDAKEADFSGLTDGNHYFYVKSGFDLNGDGNITIDEEDATPAQWVWTISDIEAQKQKQKILFWER